MLRISVTVQLCAAGFALAQALTMPANPNVIIECPRAVGYTPALPSIPGGDRPITTIAPAVELPPAAVPAAAVYAAPVRKTFFVYLAAPAGQNGGAEAGRPAGQSPLRISCFDHAAGTVPQPSILPLKEDAGTAPLSVSLALDEQGHVWACASRAFRYTIRQAGDDQRPATPLPPETQPAATETSERPAVLFRSTRPYDIRAFSRQAGPALADGRLYHVAGRGFILIGLHSADGGSIPCFATSPDGQTWDEPRPLAGIDANHSLVTAFFQGKTGTTKIGVALAAWPAGKGPLAATNVYYAETPDAGRTWQSIRQTRLDLPIRGHENGVLVWDYKSIRWTAYLKDLEFNSAGIPCIVYLGGRGGTGRTPLLCTWTVGRWVGREWETHGVIPAAGPFDVTAFQILPDRSWRQVVIRNSPATRPAHEEVVLWSSTDQGRSWLKQAWFREEPTARHVLVRPAGASPELSALWIVGPTGAGDGSPASGSAARLRFLDARGDALQLPVEMPRSDARPEPMPASHPREQP